MRAEEARTHKAEVLADFTDGLSAKAISKKYKMHERHVKMILDEAGIDAMQEYRKRIADGTYSHLMSHEPSAEWYMIRFGKSKEELEIEREKKKRKKEHAKTERLEHIERKRLAREFVSALKVLAKEKARQERQERAMAPVKAVCKHCGASWIFYPNTERYGRKNPPMYCSKKCRVKHNRHGKSAGHRLRMYGRAEEHRDVIKLDVLAEKENNTCYLCGGLVDWNDYIIDAEGNFVCGPKYPTVEHIKPLAKGGSHTWGNVGLAHHWCNCKKATGVYGSKSWQIAVG